MRLWSTLLDRNCSKDEDFYDDIIIITSDNSPTAAAIHWNRCSRFARINQAEHAPLSYSWADDVVSHLSHLIWNTGSGNSYPAAFVKLGLGLGLSGFLIKPCKCLFTKRLYSRVWKNEKIIRCEYQSPGSPVWDLVEFWWCFYPQEVSAPPKVCIGWGDRENPPLLQFHWGDCCHSVCRDLRGWMSTAVMHYHREDLVLECAFWPACVSKRIL